MLTIRHRSADRISSIFVHPPTPERDDGPSSLDAKVASASSKSSAPRDSPPIVSATTTTTLPAVRLPSPPNNSSRTMPVPLQVLPEVRSPPRRTIAMAADSLQLTQKRGRRPKLFGFTELPDSGSSASSSVANSRSNSPERNNAPIASPSAPPGPSSQFIPRRQPIRARSDTNLPTIASTSAPISTQPPPRRRENGLKLDFTGIIPVASASDAQSSVIPSPYSAKLIRKKSGEILKPALKYGGPLAANGTPLEGPRTDVSPSSPHSARFESKSCPTTPSCPKYVHFDSQLERVKLFLHDQKPQVVSRGGSPSEHYTTSEGEEYPFPPTDEERDEKRLLQIKLPNFPSSHPPEADLYLESLFLDDDRKNLRGMIMCKNLSYAKWVAVRFTFDFWQTTSEVTATHKDSVKGGNYDRFAFVIKLQDILSRIEEKTMFLALRYNTDGREIWDSNGGQNYQILFEKVAAVPQVPKPKRNSLSIQPGMGQAVGGRTSQWSITGGNADDRLADLRAKLSRLTADDMSTSPPQLSPNRERTFGVPTRGGRGARVSSPSSSPARTFSSIDTRTSDLPTAGGALAARYDFGTALKTTRKTSPNATKIPLPDVQTGLLNYKTNNGHAATEFYSPRFSPNVLPDSESLFAPTGTTTTVSPKTISTATAPSSLPVPDVTIQTPSPPAIEPTPAVSIKTSPVRPGLVRHATTPAAFVSPRDSPPSLDMSDNATDTPSESPKSPPDVSLAKWSPGHSVDSKSDMSMASYSSFIEQ